MSEKVFSCEKCLSQLPHTSFSKSQVNKLEHKKISTIRCIACTESILETTEKERLEKIKQDIKDLKRKKKAQSHDPSSLYIKEPLKCPMVMDATNFFQGEKVSFKVNMGKIKEWRTVAKIAVRGVLNAEKTEIKTVFGLFKPGTHEVIDCIESPAHHPNINKAIKIVKGCLDASKLNGYVEGTGGAKAENYEFKTYLKYVILTVERKTGKIQLSVVWNTEPLGNNKDGDYFLKSLVASILKESSSVEGGAETSSTVTPAVVDSTSNPLFHSIFVNYNPSSRYNNCITGREADSWSLLFGQEHILEVVDTDTTLSPPPQLRFPPYVFRQANITAFTKIIQNIRKWVPKSGTVTAADGMVKSCVVRGDNIVEKGVFSTTPVESLRNGVRCVELYGGVGTIGLNCLDLFAKLSCSDENPHNKVCFEETLKEIVSHNSTQRDKAVYVSLNANDVANQGGLKGYDLVVVDPPRKGLDEEVICALLDDYSAVDTIAPVNGVGAVDASTKPSNKKMYFGDDPSPSSAGATASGSVSAPSKPTLYNKRLIYVSCGFKAFKRDCARLLGETLSPDLTSSHAGLEYDEDDYLVDGAAAKRFKRSTSREDQEWAEQNASAAVETNVTKSARKQRFWKLVHAEGHVLFPGSDHIETFAVFDRILD